MATIRRRRTRSFGGGLVAVTLGAAVLLGGPAAGPAHACSCMAATDDAYFAGADAVFRGQFAGYRPPPEPVTFSGAPAIWTFAVSEVYKGDVAPSQEIVSAFSGATCGLELPHQGEFFVFATRRGFDGQTDGRLHANLCGGTRSTAAGPLALDTGPAVATSTTVAQPPPTEPALRPTVTTPVASTVATSGPAPTTTVAATEPPTETTGFEEAAGTAVEGVPTAASDDGGGGAGALVAVTVAAGALVGLAAVGVLRRSRRPGHDR
jgi:hypothetical protein